MWTAASASVRPAHSLSGSIWIQSIDRPAMSCCTAASSSAMRVAPSSSASVVASAWSSSIVDWQDDGSARE